MVRIPDHVPVHLAEKQSLPELPGLPALLESQRARGRAGGGADGLPVDAHGEGGESEEVLRCAAIFLTEPGKRAVYSDAAGWAIESRREDERTADIRWFRERGEQCRPFSRWSSPSIRVGASRWSRLTFSTRIPF